MATSAETAQSSIAAASSYDAVRRRMPLDSRTADTWSTERSLASLVSSEVIPRLVLAHRQPGAPAAAGEIIEDDVAAFAPLAVASDVDGLLARAEGLLARGVPVDTIMVDVLAPAARTLGVWWEEDRCDFVEVTMGLWRLQEVVRELSRRVPPPFDGDGVRPHRALFAAFPGDQHDFGVLMVAEMFHRHGWDVETAVAADMSALLAEVGRHHYDLVGLTLSCDCHSARLPSAILALRSVSRNPGVRVMVGGRVVNEDPELATRAGADGTAIDAGAALAVAERLVGVAIAAASAPR